MWVIILGKSEKRRGRTIWRLQSIQGKLVLSYSTLIIAVLVLLNTYPLFVTQDMMFRSKEELLQGQVLLISNTLPSGEQLKADEVEKTIALLDDLQYDRIIVTNEMGMALYDTNEESIAGEYLLISGVVSALEGKDLFYTKYEDGVFLSWASSPVISKGNVVGAVYLFESDEVQGELLGEIRDNLLMISLVICALVFAISALLSKVFLQRIAVLLSAIARVREGEYSHRIVVRGRDELAQLGEEFNELTGRLQVTEEGRRRFVSDASHELKTPLAAIKLLSDSILQENMDEETTKEFVGDIGEAADRLIRISEDLLALNRLDAIYDSKTEVVDVGKVLKDTLLLLMPLAQAAQVKLESHVEGDCCVRATEGAISQIILNLVENGIKYNYPEGKVMAELSETNESVFFVVEDTGVGIPEEDMPHIFERFYRVDKARSREAGGTGLGLAIVQETVERYGGHVEIVPRESGGLCVAVVLPRWKGGLG